jgi:hypothetical protein
MGKVISKNGGFWEGIRFGKFGIYMLTRFGFGEKWIVWMKACVFRENLSVLVNSSPTEESGVHGFH